MGTASTKPVAPAAKTSPIAAYKPTAGRADRLSANVPGAASGTVGSSFQGLSSPVTNAINPLTLVGIE